MSSVPITPEIRAKILSSIKDDGVAVAEAAKTYELTEDTIRRWLRGTLDNAHTSSSELVRLKRENQTLKEIIGTMLLDRELAKKISLARELVRRDPQLSKSAIARQFGIARSTLYVAHAKQAVKDKVLLEDVLGVLRDPPHYGHRRLALVLRRSKNTILRITRKYGLKARRKRKRPAYHVHTGRNGREIPPNRIKGLSPVCPNAIWAGDFTYLTYHGFFIYLATVINLFTREVVG